MFDLDSLIVAGIYGWLSLRRNERTTKTEQSAGAMRSKLVIWGTSGHSMVLADIVGLIGEYEIIGYLDDLNPDRHGSEIRGVPVLGGGEQLPGLRAQGVRHLMFGFASSSARMRLGTLARELDFELPSAIHPRATIAGDASVGPGTFVKAGAIIEPRAVIGALAVVGAGVVVAHDAVLETAARVSAGTIVGGLVTVGEGSWLGIGVCVKDRVRIGDRSLIGTGAVVVRDIPSRVVAYGVPARVIRKVEPDEL